MRLHSLLFALSASCATLDTAFALHHHEETVAADKRIVTTRANPIDLALPDEADAFSFVVFGDRTSGPAEGIKILAQAVGEVNLLAPDLVMTVGDLVQGYTDAPQWLEEANEYKSTMNRLACPWFPVVGNHDVYWRGKGERPRTENEKLFETNFGPLWYAFEHKKSWFIALDSDEGDPTTGKKDFDVPTAQKMSAEQFAWLDSVLTQAKDAENVFVFLHHPRWLKGGYGDDWDHVHERLAKAGNVKAVFAGHIHRMRYDGKKDGIEYFTLATVGAVNDEFAAKAGYLHEYHVVTVRKNSLSVATLPVGAAFDARVVTGELSDEVRVLAQSLRPSFRVTGDFTAELGFEGGFDLDVKNVIGRPIDITVTPDSQDSRWLFAPDHAHKTIEANEHHVFHFAARRASGTLDASYRPANLDVQVDYRGDGIRVPLPMRTWEVPLDLARLPAPPKPAVERVLELDGKNDALAIESTKLSLPEGPFTVEGWLDARRFDKRVGFLNKTESAEFGIFVNEGLPELVVHLGGKYVGAKKSGPALSTNAWHHVAGVFDGSEVRLYVDGVKVAATPASGKRTLNDLPLVIGGDVTKEGGATSFFDGDVDEIRVSKIARYSGESFTPARRFETDADTRLLLHMDGDIGPWAYDSSGRGVHPKHLGEPKLVDAH